MWRGAPSAQRSMQSGSRGGPAYALVREVLLEEVAESPRELNASGPAADHHEPQQRLDAVERLARHRRELEALPDLVAQHHGVGDFLEEAGVLRDARDAEGGRLLAAGDHHRVVSDLKGERVEAERGGSAV